MTRTPLLFQTFTIGDVTARNRIVVSPMCQYRSANGSPTDWHLVHMGRYAVGGAGIVFNEETAVELRGRKTHHCAALHDDAQIAEYRRLTELTKSLGAVPAIQIGHAGSKASGRGPLEGRVPLNAEDAERGEPPWEAISSSAVPSEPDLPAPREMNRRDIVEVVEAWGAAARRADRAGFEILEIHGAHGYLIQQFLSPLINRRGDAYGGSRRSRMRFALEVTEAVRNAWPAHKPLFYRASCVDGRGGLWSLEDTVALAAELGRLGVDLFDCSSGGLQGPSDMPGVQRRPGYHVPFARAIKAETGMKTMAPGLVTRPQQAEALLAEGVVDLVAMARELMYHAEWPVTAAEALGVPDHLALFPTDFTFRLKARAAYGTMPR